MSLTSSTGFIVVLLSVAVVQGLTGFEVNYTTKQICALKGSTVSMSCTYRYPVNAKDVKTFWFTKSDNTFTDLKTDSDYEGRVWYHNTGPKCTLKISRLKETDSAEYKFRITTAQPQDSFFGPNGVNLSVTDCPDFQVHVNRSSCCSGDTYVQAELRCRSSCRLPNTYKYTWFKNNETFWSQTSSYSTKISSDDTIACAVEGCETGRSPTVYAPKVPTVSANASGEISEGTSVTLTCSSEANPPVTKYTWYKKNADQQPVGKKNQLVFESIRPSDSGEYYCKAENKLQQRASAHVRIQVKSSPTSIVVGVTVAILLLIILVTVFFLFRRKRASKKSAESEVEPHSSEKVFLSPRCPPSPPKEQDNLHYTTVDFTQNQANAARHQKPHNPPMFSEYSAVRFHNNSSDHRGRAEESAEDPSVMYSTVNETK